MIADEADSVAEFVMSDVMNVYVMMNDDERKDDDGDKNGVKKSVIDETVMNVDENEANHLKVTLELFHDFELECCLKASLMKLIDEHLKLLDLQIFA